MLLISDVLISDDVFDVYFHCDLEKCKGACCWEGDYGAPLYDEEIKLLKAMMPKILPFLPEENQKVLERKGPSEYYKEPEVNGTSLMDDASCAFLIRDKNGIGKCSIEMAHGKGLIDFKKPLSCELYPIRLLENEEIGFIAMNYDKWEICSSGCSLGQKKKFPLFIFLKKAIVRKFGISFYEEMEAYYFHRQEKEE